MNFNFNKDQSAVLVDKNSLGSDTDVHIINMSYSMDATCIKTVEDVDRLIRGLNRIKDEIANGSTEMIIQPIASLNQSS